MRSHFRIDQPARSTEPRQASIGAVAKRSQNPDPFRLRVPLALYDPGMEKVPYLGQTLTRWQVGQSTFLALPEKGARLMNWHIRLGDGSVRDVVYWPEIKVLDDFAKVRGGNPILFPFAGRTYDRGEIGFWRDAAGVRRPMPMHGFARESDFAVTSLDSRGFAAELVPGEVARGSFPFDYEFTVNYRFEPLGLTCEFKLTNLGRSQFRGAPAITSTSPFPGAKAPSAATTSSEFPRPNAGGERRISEFPARHCGRKKTSPIRT